MEEDRSAQGRPTKFYQLTCANYANKANNEQTRGFKAGYKDCEQSEASELFTDAPELVSKVCIVREEEKLQQTRASVDCSLTLHSSPTSPENAAEVEMF